MLSKLASARKPPRRICFRTRDSVPVMEIGLSLRGRKPSSLFCPLIVSVFL
jgi:hypothetical protein